MQRALRDATYYRLALIADRLAGGRGRRLGLVLSGGLQRSLPDVQCLADALNRPLALARDPEASLRGAALYAVVRLGHAVPALRPKRVFRPRPAQARRHAVARRRQERLERELLKTKTQTADAGADG